MVVTRASSRLPGSASAPSRGAEVAKGVLAVVGALVIVVGVPVALVSAVGAPWPQTVPDRRWLTSDLSTTDLFKILAVVIWLAWAHFVVCLAVEAVFEHRRKGLAPRVPGGGIGTQRLARRLIGAIVLLAGVSTMTMTAASAAVAPASEQPPVQRHVATLRSTTGTAVAHQQAGDPNRASSGAARHIADAEPATGDLKHATSADMREKHGAVTYYEVKPPSNRNYDTLWDIAERYLGDGLRYKEIYELNTGVTQPDGRVLKNADLIYPGWVMRMPSDAKGPGLKVVEHTQDAPSSAPAEGPPRKAPGTSADHGAADDGTTARETGEPGQDTADGTGVDGPAAHAPTAVSTGAGGAAWTPVYGVAGGLLAAGLLLRLRRRRASLRPAALWAARGRGGGPDGDPPSPGSALHDEADVETADWLDRALRSWNRGASADAPVPAPIRCTVAPSGMSVAFGSVPDLAVPEAWQSSQGGRVWHLPRDTDLAGAATGPSPTPGLVTVGRRDDGSLLMLDLEVFPGLVSIGGDPGIARAVAMSIALDTATHPWGDDRRITLVGFADDLTPVGHGNIRAVDDIERVLESLDNLAGYQRSACRRADTVSARTARLSTGLSPQWPYELVVCSGVPAAPTVQRLSDLCADQQVSLAVVVVGDCPEAAARLAVTPDGRLSSDMLGVDVAAQQVSVSSARGLREMFEMPEPAGSLQLADVTAVLAAESAPAHEDQDDAAVQIALMGSLSVQAPAEADPDRRELLTEIVTFVALHPNGVHANRISAALWPRGVSEETRDAALTQTQAWLGVNADGHHRLACDSGVWRLDHTDVAVDWDRFRAALNRASDNPRARETILRGALTLVRGQPFEGVPANRYGWSAALTAGDDMRTAVNLTARAVAESAAQREDGDTARDALVQGLAMVPASEDLWGAALRLADHFGRPADTRAVADQMYAAVAAHGSPLGVSAQTEALVEEILPGYRTHAA